MKQSWKTLLILALVAVAVFHLAPTAEFYNMAVPERESLQLREPSRYYELRKDAINLGLDLQGGIHLVMEVDVEGLSDEEAKDAVARAQEVIRNRVDQFGVAEPTIQRQGDTRIIVELPGLQDVERAKNLIGQTALLEFQLVEPEVDRDRILQRISGVLAARAAEREAPAASAEEAEEKAPSLFGDIEGDESVGPGVDEEAESDPGTPPGATLASLLQKVGREVAIGQRELPAVKALLRAPRAQEIIPNDVEFLFSSKPEGATDDQYYILYLVQKVPKMTGAMIADASVSIGQSVEYLNQPIVDLLTTEEGVRVFKQVTGNYIDERLAIVLDGSVYSAPTIQSKIMNGRSIITGSGDEAEAKDLAIVLRAGALPAKVEIIEDRTVGPSLGRDSIEDGKTAALISMVLIALFMLLYYRFAGLIADLALGLNILFVFAVLAGFGAALTLPGIAGIILTIGMAVDANVLIFERIREELRTGKTVRAAIDSGYSNALSAIIDANLTTFIVGIVLYEFGTGPIRGFALTLCVGIISSLFTALVVTRTVLNLVMARSSSDTLSIGPVGILANQKFGFIGVRKIALMMSGGVLAIGLVSVVAVNHLRLGIDFAGGTLLELHFDPAVEIEAIRGQLSQIPVDDRIMDLSSNEIKQFGSAEDILIRVTESATGTGVADGIKTVLKTSFSGSIKEDLEWVRRQEKVGPKIGEELKGAAVRAVLVSLALILVYMAWRFKQFLYGIAAVIALFHDVIITVGLLSVLDIEITLVVVAALLAIVGYSLNDTIVVFDRIRENLRSVRQGDFGHVLDISINECLSRTVVTSITTLTAVIVLMTWGGEVIRDFTITLFLGIIVGTYSSVFVASPVVYLGHERAQRREKEKK